MLIEYDGKRWGSWQVLLQHRSGKILLVLLICLGGSLIWNALAPGKISEPQLKFTGTNEEHALTSRRTPAGLSNRIVSDPSIDFASFARQVTEHVLDAGPGSNGTSQQKLALGDNPELAQDVIDFMSLEGFIARQTAGMKDTEGKPEAASQSSSSCRIDEVKVKDPDKRGFVPIEVSGRLSKHKLAPKGLAAGNPFRFRYFVCIEKKDKQPAYPVVTRFEDLSNYDFAGRKPVSEVEQASKSATNVQNKNDTHSRVQHAAISSTDKVASLLEAVTELDDLSKFANSEILTNYRRNFALAQTLAVDPAFLKACAVQDKPAIAELIKAKFDSAGFDGYATILGEKENELFFTNEPAAKGDLVANPSNQQIISRALKFNYQSETRNTIPSALSRLSRTGVYRLESFAPIHLNNNSSAVLAIGTAFDSDLMRAMQHKINQTSDVPKDIILMAAAGKNNEIMASSSGLKSDPSLLRILNQAKANPSSDKSPMTISGRYMWKSFPILSSGGLSSAGQIIVCISASPQQIEFKEAANRSRLLDMALTRGEQMEHLSTGGEAEDERGLTLSGLTLSGLTLSGLTLGGLASKPALASSESHSLASLTQS